MPRSCLILPTPKHRCRPPSPRSMPRSSRIPHWSASASFPRLMSAPSAMARATMSMLSTPSQSRTRNGRARENRSRAKRWKPVHPTWPRLRERLRAPSQRPPLRWRNNQRSPRRQPSRCSLSQCLRRPFPLTPRRDQTRLRWHLRRRQSLLPPLRSRPTTRGDRCTHRSKAYSAGGKARSRRGSSRSIAPGGRCTPRSKARSAGGKGRRACSSRGGAESG